jgi:carbonic anhydrase
MEVVRGRSEKAAMKAVMDEQQRKIDELEGRSQQQEGTIMKQASEIEGLTAAKKKFEDELKRSTEANVAQKQA